MNRARLLRTLYRELELCEAEVGNDARCYDIMRNRLESMRQQSLRRTPERLESNNIIERMHELDNMAARAKRRWLRGQMHWFGAETRQQSKTELELQISNQRYLNDNDPVNSFSDYQERTFIMGLWDKPAPTSLLEAQYGISEDCLLEALDPVVPQLPAAKDVEASPQNSPKQSSGKRRRRRKKAKRIAAAPQAEPVKSKLSLAVQLI